MPVATVLCERALVNTVRSCSGARLPEPGGRGVGRDRTLRVQRIEAEDELVDTVGDELLDGDRLADTDSESERQFLVREHPAIGAVVARRPEETGVDPDDRRAPGAEVARLPEADSRNEAGGVLLGV